MGGNLENNQALNELKGKIVRIPKVDDTLSREGYAADAKKTGDALNEKVNKSDVVDNLTTDDETKPLSARQGTVIKKQLDDINLSEAGAVGYNNGTSGLEATNMQSAIDEVAQKLGDIDTISDKVDNITEDYLNKKGGGMVEGPVKVRNADNGYGEVSKNNSDTADYGTQMVDVSKDGKSAKVAVSAANDTFVYADRDGNIRNVHHEGSKPFVEYKGNGSASPRTIATKGIGRLALVYCSTHQALVSPKGADVTDLTTGERKWIDSGKVNFLNGNLNTTTSNAAINASNETYYVQVL